MVGLTDELHVSVLDSVVHHFDEVAGTVLAHPVAARFIVHFRAYSLRNKSQFRFTSLDENAVHIESIDKFFFIYSQTK